MKKIVVPLSIAGIRRLEEALAAYQLQQQQKANVLVERLATLGASVASLRFARAAYTGLKDAVVSVEEIPNGCVVKANGESVLFLEFGSGVRYGGGHPENGEFGMGPGTWSDGPNGKGHWEDSRGWWIPKSAGGGHTYGNPPAMAMYDARKTVLRELPQIVKEVFG